MKRFSCTSCDREFTTSIEDENVYCCDTPGCERFGMIDRVNKKIPFDICGSFGYLDEGYIQWKSKRELKGLPTKMLIYKRELGLSDE